MPKRIRLNEKSVREAPLIKGRDHPDIGRVEGRQEDRNLGCQINFI